MRYNEQAYQLNHEGMVVIAAAMNSKILIKLVKIKNYLKSLNEGGISP